MKGKWALGIPPRHFTWVLKNKLAICERPGGYSSNHRRVRRQEEIIWIRENRFDCVMSLITSPHNLHNYDELGVQWRHRPFNGADDGAEAALALYRELQSLLRDHKKVIVHREGEAIKAAPAPAAEPAAPAPAAEVPQSEVEAPAA